MFSDKRDHQILMDNKKKSSWDLKIDITVSKIKAFFYLSPNKMTKVIESE